jgi:hypothetical protein
LPTLIASSPTLPVTREPIFFIFRLVWCSGGVSTTIIRSF